ncbi:lipase family protein [Alloalcanivorax marinus]|uniref:lipase family protein n=1 Tax=Alloalcanivorax marinus TaxID=1177169 RepID=UPI0019349C55|nr:lipase family protein [Alloalcanivorax marinus]MBL7252110.1 alpha/beta hydrolase [Alloalcanivorax marinus]
MSSGPLKAGELPSGPSAGDMDLSPFYRWDGDVPAAPGTVLRAEEVEPQADIPAAAHVRRLLYSAPDQRWDSGQVPVSATLFLPSAPAPADGWPILAWAHGTLGIADVCAPSWAGFKGRDAAYINRWLERGFAVVATDYQGLGGPGPHPYSVWRAEGQSVLDSVRAALALEPRRLANRVVLAGQSQGGGAALGAAILSQRQAPELNILGAVITGPNSTFPDGPVALPPRRSMTMFLAFATGGLRPDGPSLEKILTPKGLALLRVARAGCTADIARKARELGVASSEELLTIPARELAALRVPTTDMPQARLPFPVLIGTGQADRTITPERQYAVAAALCAAGNRIIWRLYPGLGHDGALHGALDDAFRFVEARRAGETPPANCDRLQPPGPPGERDPDAPFNHD